MNKIIDVVIPAFNEEKSIGLVIQDIPHHLVRDIVVINNNSTDKTGEVAKSNGATVLLEERPGYGSACLKGLDYLSKREVKPDIVVFLDADYSDHPNELEQVVFPILEGDMKMVIGVRHKSKREKGSMTPQQVFGNWLATSMMQMMYGIKYNDLGPFRAIDYDSLVKIDMKDTNYGWTVEMQLKAIKHQLPYKEINVSYRKRIGQSKISGTLKGTVLAGYKIISTILKYK